MMNQSPRIRGFLLPLVWLGATSVISFGEELAQENPVRFAIATSVSKSFHRETENATRTIPTEVWKTIERSGWQVQLAEFVVDAAPSLRGVRPRGWPSHLTWENSDAIHLPTSKLLVLAEKRRNSSGKVVPSSRVGGVLRHELGHAFDMALGGRYRFFSSRADFVNAYQLDVRSLSEEERETFKYYLQGSRAGWQEAFAEAFAVSLGGGSSDVEPAEFDAAFPRVVSHVRKLIDAPPQLPAAQLTAAQLPAVQLPAVHLPTARPQAAQARQPARVSKLPSLRGRLLRRR